jgi:hypothetical protein
MRRACCPPSPGGSGVGRGGSAAPDQGPPQHPGPVRHARPGGWGPGALGDPSLRGAAVVLASVMMAVDEFDDGPYAAAPAAAADGGA